MRRQPGLSPWACKGHADRQSTLPSWRLRAGAAAGTRKRAPVQRRGPHTVRRRKSREQVNQTSEEKTEDDVAGMLRNRQKWELFKLAPSTWCHHWDNSTQQSPQFNPPGGGEKSLHQGNLGEGGGEEKSGYPSANPSTVPDQLWP